MIMVHVDSASKEKCVDCVEENFREKNKENHCKTSHKSCSHEGEPDVLILEFTEPFVYKNDSVEPKDRVPQAEKAYQNENNNIAPITSGNGVRIISLVEPNPC
mmetsp:Transcript_8165/g.12524  ORF Transcript_8165/g.12524 Transcript_8165/m.12524 type:complete len:103 (+) Transcript_8165:1997-2305(+)